MLSVQERVWIKEEAMKNPWRRVERAQGLYPRLLNKIRNEDRFLKGREVWEGARSVGPRQDVL